MGMYSSVDCCEEHGTARENFGEDATECDVVLRCDWADRYLLVADLLDNRRAWPNLSAWTYPPRAVTCAGQPVKSSYTESGQQCVYTDYLLAVRYSTDAEEDLVAETVEPTAEFITQDYRRFRWGSAAGTPILEAEAPGKLLHGLNLVRQIFKWSSPLPGTLLTCVGGVNNAAYVSALLNLTFATETLLFQPPTLNRTVTTAGAKAWNATMKFSYKPDNWNKFWRAATEDFERMYDYYGGQYDSYPQVDFSDFLF